MEKSLFKGDFIIINKLFYGPILPNDLGDVPFGNLLPNSYLRSENKKIKRLNGFTSIQRNDIITFKLFKKESKVFVKRVIGLSGEELLIDDSIVFVDNKAIEELSSYLFEYNIIKDKLKLGNFVLTNEEYEKKLHSEKLERKIHIKNREADEVFPEAMLFNWNRDNYGPVQIPKKGSAITVNKNSIKFYKEIIEYETDENLSIGELENDVLLGNKKIEFYTFKENYFFVMGDNRHFSRDSRAFGFISESKIIGKLNIKL